MSNLWFQETQDIYVEALAVTRDLGLYEHHSDFAIVPRAEASDDVQVLPNP